MKFTRILKRTGRRGQRLIPYSILKFGDVLLQSVNPVFWVRAIRTLKEFAQLMRQQRVEINAFEEQHGLSAIMYFTGDISIYIDPQKIENLDSDLVTAFTNDLRKKSHTITRLPSVIITWLGHFAGFSIYWNWESLLESINPIIHNIQRFI